MDDSEHLTDDDLVAYVDGDAAPDVRARLRDHIDACVACRELLATMVRLGVDPDSDFADDPSTETALPIMRQAGRYELSEVLGMGAMGIVYAAYDPELGRRVAVKLLRPAADDPHAQETRRRFVREAKSIARVVHPNVVAIYDVGQVDEQTFIAMELVPGGTLRDWLQRGSHRLDETLALFDQIGRGLGAVHKAGLVHRDFKPENILLGEDARPRVTDFGLARADFVLRPLRIPATGMLTSDDATPAYGTQKPPALVAAAHLTQTGALLGTPAYMAPEQLRGEPVDVRSDVFAFCVVLYEAVIGCRPFAGNSVAEIERAIMHGAFVRTGKSAKPATRTQRVLMALLERGLAADPQARFATLDELLAQLWEIHHPATPKRRRTVASSIAAALVAASVATSWAIHRRANHLDCDSDLLASTWSPALRIAARAQIAKPNNDAANVAADATLKTLDQFASVWRTAQHTVCSDTYERHEYSEHAFDSRMLCLVRARRQLALLTASFATNERVYLQAPNAASLLYSPAECLSQTADQGRSPDEERHYYDIEGILDEANNLARFSRTAVATPLYTKVAADAERARFFDLASMAYQALAEVAVESTNSTEAPQLWQHGIVLALDGHAFRLAAQGWSALIEFDATRENSVAHLQQWRELAEWALRMAASEQSPNLGADASAMRALNYAVGTAYFFVGKPELAERELRLALSYRGYNTHFGGVPIANIEKRLGDVLIDLQKYDEAEKLLRRARVDMAKTFFPDSPAVLTVDGSLAYLASRRDGPAAAVPIERAIVATLAKYGDDQVLLTVQQLTNLAGDLEQSHQLTEALATDQKAAALATKLDTNHLLRMSAELGYGTSLRAHGQDGDALPHLEEAYRIAEANHLTNDAQMMMICAELGGAVVEHDRARARQLLNRAETIGTELRSDDAAQVAAEIAKTRREHRL